MQIQWQPIDNSLLLCSWNPSDEGLLVAITPALRWSNWLHISAISFLNYLAKELHVALKESCVGSHSFGHGATVCYDLVENLL